MMKKVLVATTLCAALVLCGIAILGQPAPATAGQTDVVASKVANDAVTETLSCPSGSDVLISNISDAEIDCTGCGPACKHGNCNNGFCCSPGQTCVGGFCGPD